MTRAPREGLDPQALALFEEYGELVERVQEIESGMAPVNEQLKELNTRRAEMYRSRAEAVRRMDVLRAEYQRLTGMDLRKACRSPTLEALDRAYGMLCSAIAEPTDGAVVARRFEAWADAWRAHMAWKDSRQGAE